MKLIDSNILIYASYPEYAYLRPLVMDTAHCVSAISKVEVLGYHKLSEEELRFFSSIFEILTVILPDQRIYDHAVMLRQQQRIKLGDSLIAATALAYQLPLYTRNEADFVSIPGLTVRNPVHSHE
ncbi:MAG: type II toxin-antitoxin system VapC family toxin [Bacteroidia bacterium]|nr:type II toxin-antitoxin system VapC family toxin [Bacteroidia bacterium]